MTKNVIVTDEFGRKISSTYPKRAKGLIKTGRAELISEQEIRLIGSCPTDYDSEDIMYNLTNDNIQEQVKHKLYFNSREWRFNPDCKTNTGERTMITDMNGAITEAWCFGKWGKNNLTEIQSENLSLPKNTDFIFTFWLNGGENDRFEELCQLQIIFDDDYENRYTFKLNRNTIRPVKMFKGWVLFEIPFTTGNNTYTRLRFAVDDAHCAILRAEDKEKYELLPNETTDPKIPQRHNIVFEDGYPRNSSWSHLVFGAQNGFDGKKLTQNAKTVIFNIGETAGEYAGTAGKIAGETVEKAVDFAKKAVDYTGNKAKNLKRSAVNSDFVKNYILNDLDFDEESNPEPEDNDKVFETVENINNEVTEQINNEIAASLKNELEQLSKKIDSLLK